MQPTSIPYISPPGEPEDSVCLEKIFKEECVNSQQELLYKEVKTLALDITNNVSVTERELAILFLDLRNYTGLLQSQPAKEVIQVVKRLFGVFSKVISAYGGRVIDRAGDSLYAVFGLADNISEATNQAFRSVNMLFDTLRYFNDHFAIAQYGHPLEMGIGLHAGEVIIEQQQNEQGTYLSVMGLPVNIAARLQAETKTLNNDLILSAKAYNLIEPSTREGIKSKLLQIHLPGVKELQFIWLAGKAYVANTAKRLTMHDMDYLLAIAG